MVHETGGGGGWARIVVFAWLVAGAGRADAVSAPSAVRTRTPSISPKSLSLPPSIAEGLDDCGVQVEFAPLNVQAIAEQDAERARAGEKALRIGVTRDLPERVSLAGGGGGAGQWDVLSDGAQVWRLTLRAAGAHGVRVHLSGVELPDGCELRVFGADDPTAVRGPYTAGTLKGRTAFWAGAVFAATVTVECYVPRGLARSGLALTVDQIAHLYQDPAVIAKEGSCHNDVSCYPAWAGVAQGVAGIGVFYDRDYLFCTGCLLNDLDESTWVDFFLTANHCVANQSEADETEFYWFFQTSTCAGTPPALSSVTVTEGGADYLAGRSYRTGSDFALLRLRNPSPDGATYAGWTTDTPAASATLASIHHPDGAYKRISFCNRIDQTADFWYVNFTDGATEPGSSGAPLFNGSGRVIGQLYGGDSACPYGGIDIYGRFDAMYPYVSSWLARDEHALLPVVDPPYGTYNGPLYRGRAGYSEVRGTLTLTASKTGRVTAKAVLPQRSVSFSGKAWAGMTTEGKYVAVLRASGGEELTLDVDWIYGYGTISGGSLGSETLTVDLTYDVFGDSKDSYAQADLANVRGYYTMALPVNRVASEGSARAAPEGSGYLTLTVGNKGSFKLAGKLADGTSVSRSGKVLLFGDYGSAVSVPFFQTLYSKKGSVGGLLWIDPVVRTLWGGYDNAWAVWWDKPGSGPDGFSVRMYPYGGYYNKSAALAAHYRLSAETNAVPYYLAGAPVAVPQAVFPEWVGVASTGSRLTVAKGARPSLVDGAYDYSGENSALASLSFSAFTGLYKGAFNQYYDYVSKERLVHKTVKASYAGALTQRYDTWSFDDAWPEGQGYYLVSDNNPAVKAYRLKRSFWMDLYIAP